MRLCAAFLLLTLTFCSLQKYSTARTWFIYAPGENITYYDEATTIYDDENISNAFNTIKEEEEKLPNDPLPNEIASSRADDQPIMVQQPIDYSPPLELKNLNQACRFNEECKSHCCLFARDTHKRTCRPLAKQGEPCTVGQIKVKHYADYCPCENGEDACKHP
ncbi:uncharacterized protein B4U79_05742, partial [Dinothrombium tinctorium]